MRLARGAHMLDSLRYGWAGRASCIGSKRPFIGIPAPGYVISTRKSRAEDLYLGLSLAYSYISISLMCMERDKILCPTQLSFV